MVYDILNNAKLYYGLGPAFEKALKALETLDFEALKPGNRYFIDDKMSYNLQLVECSPPDDDYYEAHVKYADIQLIVSGTEYMGVSNISSLSPRIPYSSEKDIAWYSGKGNMLRFSAGDFAIFFPEDAHMPCRNDGSSSCSSQKIVVKVPLD